MISIIWIMSFAPMKFIDFLSKLFMHRSFEWKWLKMSPYLRSVECWLCGPVLWCRRCHAVHVLPVPRGRFTTGNLQLFMWRSLGRDNGNIWTQHSQSTHTHTHHFYPELHTHISLTTKCFIILTSLYCWVLREASAGPSIVCPRASVRYKSVTSSSARVRQCRSIPCAVPGSSALSAPCFIN